MIEIGGKPEEKESRREVVHGKIEGIAKNEILNFWRESIDRSIEFGAKSEVRERGWESFRVDFSVEIVSECEVGKRRGKERQIVRKVGESNVG